MEESRREQIKNIFNDARCNYRRDKCYRVGERRNGRQKKYPRQYLKARLEYVNRHARQCQSRRHERRGRLRDNFKTSIMFRRQCRAVIKLFTVTKIGTRQSRALSPNIPRFSLWRLRAGFSSANMTLMSEIAWRLSARLWRRIFLNQSIPSARKFVSATRPTRLSAS